MEVVIIGAGSFGASLAWTLARGGDDVTLVDQFVAGDPRSSSGGETRLMRCAHGADADYTASARRARTLWRELEAESGEELYEECGVAWFARRADGWEAESERVLGELGAPTERADPTELYPSVAAEDLDFTLLEPEAGVLRAQRAVRALAAQARAHGARIVSAAARPEGAGAVLDDGTSLDADAVVWACGAWLGELFPEVVSLKVTRQEVLFFDGGTEWGAGQPAWVDYDGAMYGTADIDGHGFKASLDHEGPAVSPFDALPEGGATEGEVRSYLSHRFPALAAAALAAARTCRYELTPDTRFIASAHPEHERVWLMGGGSGHGFKHGPALAEAVAAALRGGDQLPERFGLGERSASRSLRTAGSGS
jgi:glycine/D-amino acid oxidase-like deaminating enzyme